MQWIEEFLQAVEIGINGMDWRTLEPIDCFEIIPLYAKESTEYLLKIIDMTKDVDPGLIAKDMHSPSAIRIQMILSLIKGNVAGASKEDMAKIATFYYKVLQAGCTQDPFTKYGKNHVHKEHEIKSILAKLKNASPQIARELGKLANSCYHVSHALYSDINPQICYENFGPYDVSKEYGKGHIVVIKQFTNLAPVELWKEKIGGMPHKEIKMCYLYKDVNLKVDMLSHATYEGDLLNGLQKYAIEIDGREIEDITHVSKITQKIGLKAIEMWNHLTSLDFEDAKRVYLEQECYNFINVCKRVGIDWKPSEEMIKAVRGKVLVKEFVPKFESNRELGAFWNSIIDPRKE